MGTPKWGISVAVILISVIVIDYASADGWADNCDLHKWMCKSETGNCVRTDSDDASADVLYETQNICRLVCGQYATLWPMPVGDVQLGQQIKAINLNNIRYSQQTTSLNVNKFVNQLMDMFLGKLERDCESKECGTDVRNGVGIMINVESSNLELTWNTNECYSLLVSSQTEDIISVEIEAETVYGARHALETLSQLFEKRACENSLVMLTQAFIRNDCPVFTHRGLLLDTARNFISVPYIRSMLEAMSLSKLNVLHWHITDTQSFPMEVPSVPEMTRFGAYSAKKIYSQKEIRKLIKQARFYGIRVIIEIDSPAHAGFGWQWGANSSLGDLAVCVNKQPWRQFCVQPPCGQLNPVNPNTYDIMSKIYSDILRTIPVGESIHMGGDEVFIPCWRSTQEIVDYLIKKGHSTSDASFIQLWGEFQGALLQLWDRENQLREWNDVLNSSASKTSVILWTSHLTNPDIIENFLPNDRYIIQSWVPSTDDLPHRLLELGYRVIFSTKDAWYLDHGFWINGATKYYTWKRVYDNVIPRKEGVLGGEACMWSEYVDESAIESRIWPRAAAFAERMWADPLTTSKKAQTRLYRHRERLITAGIHPEAMYPTWCVQNDGECD